MLQTYEAVLDCGQFRWIDMAPTLPKAQLWVTVRPLTSFEEKLPTVTPKLTGMIALLANQPKFVGEANFLTREQANER